MAIFSIAAWILIGYILYFLGLLYLKFVVSLKHKNKGDGDFDAWEMSLWGISGVFSILWLFAIITTHISYVIKDKDKTDDAD